MSLSSDHTPIAGDSSLAWITTQWSRINHPEDFVLRYAPAIQRYLKALIRHDQDAEEVAQEFLMRAFQRGFPHASPSRGRFRDYLFVSLRNAAISYIRKKQTENRKVTAHDPELLPDEVINAAEAEWVREWQTCILTKAWRSLYQHERRSPGNLAYTVLKIRSDFPEESNEQVLVRTVEKSGRDLAPEAFRKQLSRARRIFAEMILDEVIATLQNPSASEVEAELSELHLMSYVSDFLPVDWQTSVRLSPVDE